MPRPLSHLTGFTLELHPVEHTCARIAQIVMSDAERAKAELKRYYNPGFSREREQKLRKNERDRRNR